MLKLPGPRRTPAARRRLRCCALLAVVLLAATATPAQQAAVGPAEAASSYAGRSLAEALQELRARGLRILFTTSVVRPEMVIAGEPAAGEPRRQLEELLNPFGLEAVEGAGGTIVIVPRSGASAGRPQAITGTIHSRRDGSPIAGVAVRLLETGNRTTTAPDGGFRLAELSEGSYTLEVRRRGFVVERLPGLPVTADGGTHVDILLDPAPITEEWLEVTPSRVSLLREQPVAPLALSREDILSLPHLGDDFFRALSLLPGVTSNDLTAEFHVRGGRRDETQILLDGQELYDTFHLKDFDSALSVVAPATLEHVDLSTGGFPVRHGDRMSGVLDMTTATPTGPRRLRFGLGLLSAQAGGAGAFDSQRGSWLVQLRRGTADLASRLLGRERPRYWDGFGKLDYQLARGVGLRINALRSGDELEVLETVEGELKHFETDYQSSYLWLTLVTVLDAERYFETAVSRSRVERDRFGLELEEDVQFEISDRRRLEVLAVRQEWNLGLSPRDSLEAGFSLRRFDADYDYRGSGSFDNPLARVRANPFDSIDFRGRFRDNHGAVYVAERRRFGERLTAEVGLRYDRYTLTDESLLSPRLNFAWAVGTSGVVRLAWGRFTQSQRPYELQVEDGETEFRRVERSEHRVLGYERLWPRLGRSPGLALRIELYQRRVRNPLPRYENLYEAVNTFPEVEPDRVLVAPERGVAEGIEFFLRGSFGDRIGWWINYSWASTEDQIDGRRVPRRYDQPHTLNLDLDYRISRHWKLNLAWRYHTGWPTTPLSLEREVDAEGEVELVPVLGPAYSRRLSDYHRLDLRASRDWRLGSGVLSVFLDVQNVYDRGNLAGFDYQIDQDTGAIEPNPEQWVGILPSLGVSYEF